MSGQDTTVCLQRSSRSLFQQLELGFYLVYISSLRSVWPEAILSVSISHLCSPEALQYKSYRLRKTTFPQTRLTQPHIQPSSIHKLCSSLRTIWFVDTSMHVLSEDPISDLVYFTTVPHYTTLGYPIIQREPQNRQRRNFLGRNEASSCRVQVVSLARYKKQLLQKFFFYAFFFYIF